jgi:hypothetical protein
VSELRERLWLLGFYLRHPLTWLCDNGYRECAMHKRAGFYEYLASASVGADQEGVLPQVWVADEEEWAWFQALLTCDDDRDMPRLQALMNSTPPWEKEDEDNE